MNQQELKLIKVAYAAQLRHTQLTEKDLAGAEERNTLAKLVSVGYLKIDGQRGEGRYSLTESGRAMVRVVLAGGVYDVVHVGHLAALTEAKKLGDFLVVVVATDITVETLKGRKPVFPQEDRRTLIEGLKPVDAAILGYEDVGFGFEQILSEVKPDIVAFGYDQQRLEGTVAEIIQRRKLKIKIMSLSRFENERYVSSSLLRQKLSEELS